MFVDRLTGGLRSRPALPRVAIVAPLLLAVTLKVFFPGPSEAVRFSCRYPLRRGKFRLFRDLAKGTHYEGKSSGHDEPSLLSYSNKPGSGNSSTYFLRIPKDPRSSPSSMTPAARGIFNSTPRFDLAWPGVIRSRTPISLRRNFTANVCNRMGPLLNTPQ
jgi:hypothetical protein